MNDHKDVDRRGFIKAAGSSFGAAGLLIAVCEEASADQTRQAAARPRTEQEKLDFCNYREVLAAL